MDARTITCLAGLLILGACTRNTPASEKAAPQPPSTYSPLPADYMDSLAGQVTQIDYLFYNLPISMSTGEPSSIRALMSHYEPGSSISLNHGCQSIGRIFYVGNGENLLAADLFFRDSCRFAIFLEGETPLYAARITDKGASFLLNAGVPLSSGQ